MAQRRSGKLVWLALATHMAQATSSAPTDLVANSPPAAPIDTNAILVELAETDRMIALLERKLTSLRDLRRLSLGGTLNPSSATADTEDVLNQELEAVLAQSTPSFSTCHAPPLPSSDRAAHSRPDVFHRWFVERHAGELNVVAIQPFHLAHPRFVHPLSLLFTAAANGTLSFYELPAGTLVKAVQLPPRSPPHTSESQVVAASFTLAPTPHVSVVHSSGHRVVQKVNVTFDWASATPSTSLDVPAISVVDATPPATAPLDVTDSQRTVVAASSTAFHDQPLHFVVVTEVSSADDPMAKSESDGQPPPMQNTVHVLDDAGIVLHTLTALDARVPVRSMSPHRHLLAITQATSVHLFPLSRLGEQVHYVCEGSRSPVVALAFDTASPSIMYATVASGDVLVFDMYVDRTRTCRLLHRLPPAVAASSRASAILALPGYILVASQSMLALWNVTNVATDRPRFVTGATHTYGPHDSTQGVGSSHPVLVALLPRLDLEDQASAGARDLAVVANVGHSTVFVLESFLPVPSPAAPTSLGSMDLSWLRLPLLVLVAVVVAIYKTSTKSSSMSSPDGSSPASAEELERMLRQARNAPRDTSSTGTSRGCRDPTFDPTPLSYTDYNSRQATSFDRPRPTTSRPSYYDATTI